MSELEFPNRLLEQGDREGAFRELSRILRKNPRNISAWFLLANTVEDVNKRIDCYKQIISIDSENDDARWELMRLESNITGNTQQNNLLTLSEREITENNKVDDLTEKAKSKQDISSVFKDYLTENKETKKDDVILSKAKIEDEIKKLESRRSQYMALTIACSVIGFIAMLWVFDVIGESLLAFFIGVTIFMLIVALPASRLTPLEKNIDNLRIKNNPIKSTPQVRSINIPAVEKKSTNVIVKCRTCGEKVSKTALSCPHCGESYPGVKSKCPVCHSSNYLVQQKGFSLGKAGAGAVLLGPVGLVGGFHGSKDAVFVCVKCKNKWKPDPQEFL